jgi:P-type Ca2+ transporter type 2C
MSEKPMNLDDMHLAEMPNQPIAWHAIEDELVYRKLQTDPQGLTRASVEERLTEFGRNTLPAAQPPTLLQVILHQFKSPLIYILLVAAGIALVMQDYKDFGFIMAVIVLNAAIGTAQEWKAEQSAHALQEMLKVQARVRRDNGQQYTVDAEELVPGDVVLLESGNKVPADLRLVQVNSLAIDESFLTGESIAAQKKVDLLPQEAPVSDRTIMAYAGATVVSGRGVGLVVATGRYTEVGKIAKSVAEEVGAKPPLVLRMEKFSRQISVIVLVFAAVLGLIAFSRGMPGNEVLFLVIAMAVSAIPEGLPVAMTVALSLSTSRMAKRNVIVRRLTAVESLGSCTIIASDKTGTLTVNQQTVRVVAFPGGNRILFGGQGYNDQGEVEYESGELDDDKRERLKLLARSAVLANEATLERVNGEWSHNGDAMDVAFLAMAYKLGVDPRQIRQRYPAAAELPFESEKRYAASLNEMEDGCELIVKGAMEVVLSSCSEMLTSQGPVPVERERMNEKALGLAEEGFRVLAIATRRMPQASEIGEIDESMLQEMTLLGLVGFIDPLRQETRDAVETAKQAGIKVAMITGDHPATALAIARDLGIAESHQQVVTGQELSEIGDVQVPEFYERVKHATVFARVSPDQKLHIVDAMMNLGNFVAVTGDGVNDAPALRKANIGVAMGSGTDVAKDTASLIVTDDNFSSIVAGVEEGRHAYANVRKVTLLLIATGLAELVLIALSILVGLPIPLLAVQILWLNLVTNGIQDVALAFEAGEKGVMKQPPRSPSEGIFNRKMIEQVLLSGIVMSLICFAGWWMMLDAGWSEDSARNGVLTLLVMLQFYHVFNSRSEYNSIFRIPLSNNPVLALGMLLAFLIHFLATEVPFLQSLLRTEPLPLQYWLIFAAAGSVLLVVMEAYKWISSRRSNSPARA